MKWFYVGCDISSVPKELLSDDRRSEEEIKQLLQNVPLSEDSINADSLEDLVKILFNNGIYPIKIRRADELDHKIDMLNTIKSDIKRSKKPKDEKVKHVNKLSNIIPPSKFILFYKEIIVILIVIVICILTVCMTILFR